MKQDANEMSRNGMLDEHDVAEERENVVQTVLKDKTNAKRKWSGQVSQRITVCSIRRVFESFKQSVTGNTELAANV